MRPSYHTKAARQDIIGDGTDFTAQQLSIDCNCNSVIDYLNERDFPCYERLEAVLPRQILLPGKPCTFAF
jgi:hypothetical protein